MQTNIGLAKLAGAIVELHPELFDGVDLDAQLNASCALVVQKWSDTLKSRFDSDSIVLIPDWNSVHATHRSASETQASEACLSMGLECEEVFRLKPFVKASSSKDLAMEAMRALDDIMYKGIDVWTPQSIRDAYSYEAWFGATTNKEFLSEFEDQNGEPFDVEESSGRVLPDDWDKKMADSGYIKPSSTKKWSNKRLNEFSLTACKKEKNLVKAILAIRKLAKAGQVRSTDEESYGNTQPAFLFFWDDDDMLGHAIDEIYEQRWNSGEGRDSQISVVINPSLTKNEAMMNVTAFEKIVEIQNAVGSLFDAMAAISKV